MQEFAENDITNLVFIVAEVMENHPEFLKGFRPDTMATAYKALAAAPLVEGGYRDIQVRLSVSPNTRRGW